MPRKSLITFFGKPTLQVQLVFLPFGRQYAVGTRSPFSLKGCQWCCTRLKIRWPPREATWASWKCNVGNSTPRDKYKPDRLQTHMPQVGCRQIHHDHHHQHHRHQVVLDQYHFRHTDDMPPVVLLRYHFRYTDDMPQLVLHRYTGGIMATCLKLYSFGTT